MEQYQTADILKWIWRKKFIYVLILLHKGVPKNNENFFANVFREFSKKFAMALLVYPGAWEKLIHKKTWSRKSRGTVPLKRLKIFLYFKTLKKWWMWCSARTQGVLNLYSHNTKMQAQCVKTYLHLRSGKYSIMDDDLLPIKYWDCSGFIS